MLPYRMAGAGYPGLLIATLLLVWRYLASLEARTLIGTNATAAD